MPLFAAEAGGGKGVHQLERDLLALTRGLLERGLIETVDDDSD